MKNDHISEARGKGKILRNPLSLLIVGNGEGET